MPVHSSRTLGVTALCVMTFMNVSGGPWGAEGVISALGPLPGLVGMIIFAAFWGLPIALMTAELSSALPDNGGYSLWVSTAFGEVWGFQLSWWSWSSGVIDNALYPVLAYESAVKAFAPDFHNGFVAWCFKAALAVLWSIPCLFSAPRLMNVLLVLSVLMLAPFLYLAVSGMLSPLADWSRLLEYREDKITSVNEWGNLVGLLYWNFSGFDCTSTCAGEVKNPRRSYPIGLGLALLLSLTTYLLTLGSATLVNTPEWRTWDEGSLSVVGRDQLGDSFLYILLVCSFISNFGQYVAELFEDSWQLYGMGVYGLAPKPFAYRHPVYQAPWTSVLFQLAIILALVSFNFESILVIDNCFSVAGSILEVCSFLWLRYTRPELPRPYKFPVHSLPLTILAMIAPLSLGLFVLYQSFLDSKQAIVINSILLLSGFCLYAIMKTCTRLKYQRDETIPLIMQTS